METDRGRIAVGWLIVEDLAMVFALVLFPALAACSAATATRSMRTRWRPVSGSVSAGCADHLLQRSACSSPSC